MHHAVLTRHYVSVLQVAELLGPKTEADLAPRAAKKPKARGQAAAPAPTAASQGRRRKGERYKERGVVK